MSRMSDLDAELHRLGELDLAVRSYLSHLYAFEQGAEHDEAPMTYWREQLEVLTDGETFDYRPEEG